MPRCGSRSGAARAASAALLPAAFIGQACAHLCAGVPQRRVKLLEFAQEDVVEAQCLGNGQACNQVGSNGQRSKLSMGRGNEGASASGVASPAGPMLCTHSGRVLTSSQELVTRAQQPALSLKSGGRTRTCVSAAAALAAHVHLLQRNDVCID